MTRRKDEILKTAMELIACEGMGVMTMKRVAKEMGFTEAAMYRHFSNKNDLVISLIRLIREKFAEIFSGMDSGKQPSLFFADLLDAMLNYLTKVQGVTIQFLSESTYNNDEAIRKELSKFYFDLILRIKNYLKNAKKRGHLRKNTDIEAAAILFTGIIQSLTIRYLISGKTIKLQEKSREVLDVFLKGVVR